jgi:hypothetical protein
MSHTVDSIRKHQKMIVLGVALAVIALYIIPLDQITMALTHAEKISAHFAKIRAKISGNTHIPQDVRLKLDAKLSEVEYKLLARLASHGL